jgi:hypothetical protein
MADLTITATQVLPAATGVSLDNLYAGEAIDCGEVYYVKAADGKAWLAKALTAAEAAARGVCVGAAKAAGQMMTGQKTGLVTLGAGAAPAVGTPYFVSDNAGKIAPLADLGAADFMTLLGWGASGNKLSLDIGASGIAHA